MIAIGLAGCQAAGFYRQAIHGQLQILARQKSIEKLLAGAQTPPPLKEKFQLVLRLRGFAESQLKLRANGHYLQYADLQRPYVVWNVHAAPEFSLTPRSWWYPIVGRLTYRGYFSEALARRYAARLADKGAEVYVEGVEAYSTLGWFKDPVLNTFIHHEEFELAETLFHELAHQRVFVSGDTDFNEAFATAVAEAGVRRWLAAAGDSAAAAQHRLARQHKDQFVQLVMRVRQQLESLYATNSPPQATAEGNRRSDSTSRKGAADLSRQPRQPGGLSVPSLAEHHRREKQRLLAQLRRDYEQLKAQWGGYAGYDHWFAQPLNNAQLNTVATYYQLVPAFDRLLQTNGGDFEKFYGQVSALGRVPKPERHRTLQHWLENQ